MPTISFSGLSSGIDTSGWVDALVSVKQQTVTSLQEQQEAQEALLNVVNEIKSYFSSFQSCLEKLTDSQFGIPSMDLFMQNLAVSSNTNIATATATTEAARQSYDVAVDSLATATKATSGYTQYETKYATLDTQIGLLGAKNGTITVNQQSFSVTTEDTIRSLIQKFQNVGVSAAFDGQKGTFTVGVSLSEIDEGATNIKSALKLQDSTVSGAISGSLVYADRDTEFSKLGLTDGKVIIEGVEHTIAQNGNSYTITKSGGTAANLNTVGDFLDYLMSSAVGAESADVDDMGNISIKGATLDAVTGGSNIIDILNLSETFNRTAMESNRLTYIDVHVADLNTKLSDMGINAATTLTVGGNTHNITQDMTLGDVQNLLAAGNVDFDIDDKGVITIDTKGNEISGTLLDVLGLDPSKNGSTITSTAHESHYDATGDTLLSDLGINNSYNYVAYDSEGKALTGNVNNVANKTIDELIADLRNAGLEVEFDDTTHQIVIKDGYIEGTLADALGMSKNTTSYTESATGNTTLEKLGATGDETLTIDGGAAKTYGKDTTLETVLNDIKAAGADVTFKDGNVTIQGVTLGGTLPALLGLDATTQGTSVTSGALTVVTDSSASGSDMDATIEHDISLSSKIGDILGTSSNYTLSVDGGTATTYTKDTTLQTLKNQIEAAGGKFTINDDNTISIEDVTMSGTLVGALGFDSVEDGTRFSTVNPVYIPGATTVANGSTSLDELFGGASGISTFSAAPARMAAPAAAPRAGGYTLSIDGGAEISYANGVTLDDIFADIIAAGGSASIDADGYIVIDGVHLEGTLVDALGLVETSYGTTITSGNLEVTESMTSTSSSVLMGEKEGNLSWSSTVGSITGDDKSYLLGINGTTHSYDTDVTLTDIKNDIVAAGGNMTLNSDNTISITGVAIDGTLAAALGFDVTDYKTTISSNTPIYAKTEDVEADASTTFNDLGINTNLRDYAIYLPDGTVVKASSTTGSSGTATIGDWLNQINNALNTANGTSGKTYAKIEDGIISITGGGYVTGSLPTALGMLTEEVITGTTMVGTPISYIEYEPLKYITSIQNGEGESGKDITYTGSIGNATNQSGTAADAVTSDGLIGPEDEFVDLFGNITDATLDATLSELLTPGASDPLNNDARLPADSYTLKIGSYATKTFDSDTTTLRDVVDYIENLKVYDPTYDMAFDAYLSGNKLVLKTDMDISGTLADVIGLTKVKTEDEYYTYVAKNIQYTAVVEGASNGFNFSIVGDKVEYDKTEIGNKDGYEYTGNVISSSETVADSDGFITTPGNVTGGGSGTNTTVTIDPDGFIQTPGNVTGGGSNVSVDSDGFITNPDIHNPPAGGGGTTITRTEYYYQGSKISYTETDKSYASGSTKLVDLFGSDVIGKTLVISHYNGGGHSNGAIVDTPLDPGIGSNTGAAGSSGSILEPQIPTHTGMDSDSKTITIDANTTLNELSRTIGFANFSYNSSTGKFTMKTQNATDGCRGTVLGTFITYLDSKLGSSSPSLSTDKYGMTTTTQTWQTDYTSESSETFDVTLSTTLKEMMGMANSSINPICSLSITNNGKTSNLNFDATDTIQDVIDELKGLGLSVYFTDGALKVSSIHSDFNISFGNEASGSSLQFKNLFAEKLFGGTVPTRQTETTEFNMPSQVVTVITKDTSLGTLGIISGTIGTTSANMTFTSDDTLGDLISWLESNGASVVLGLTGDISISSNSAFQGDLLSQLGLTSETVSGGGETSQAITEYYYQGSRITVSAVNSGSGSSNGSNSNLHTSLGGEVDLDYALNEEYYETIEGGLLQPATGDNLIFAPSANVKLSDIGLYLVNGGMGFTVTNNGVSTDLSFSTSDTIGTVVDKLNALGLKASYAPLTGLRVSSEYSDFEITASVAQSTFVNDLFGGSIPSRQTNTTFSSGSVKYTGTTVQKSENITEDTLISSFNPDIVGAKIGIRTVNNQPGQMFSDFTIGNNTTVGDVIDYFKNKSVVHDVELNGKTITISLSSQYQIYSDSVPYSRPLNDSTNNWTLALGRGSISVVTTSTALQEITGRYDLETVAALHNLNFYVNGTNHNLTFVGKDTIQDVLDGLNAVDGITASFTNGKLTVESTYSDLSFAPVPVLITDIAPVLFGGSVPTPENIVADSGDTILYSGKLEAVGTGSTSGAQYVSEVDDFVAGNTYLIKSAADLNKLAELVNNGKDTTNVTFILEQNIDMSSVSNFAGIGNSSNAFKGIFYGNGHIITNLTMSSTGDNVGLFGSAENATIQDVGLATTSITGGSNVGALIGSDFGSLIENVFVMGGKSGSLGINGTNNVAGLIGNAEATTILSSYVAGTLVNANTYVGGIVGNGINLTISNSYAEGILITGDDKVGGFVGRLEGGNISNSFAYGVFAYYDASGAGGGLAGELINSDIDTFYISGGATAGSTSPRICIAGKTINSSFSNVVHQNVGAAFGNQNTVNGVISATRNLLYNQSFMESNGFTTDKGWVYDGAAPTFGNATVTSTPATKTYVSTLDDFVAGETYYISTSADLNKLASLVNSGKDTTDVSFILENDIDMSSVSNFAGIGRGNTFKGKFYGNGHTISNLTSTVNSGDNVGLFGAIDGALIQDLGLKNVKLTGSGTTNSMGALAGRADNSTIKNVFVDEVTVTNGHKYIGGLIGETQNTNIESAYVTDASIEGDDFVGGLVGKVLNYDNTHGITNSYVNNTSVTGISIGGLVGGISGGFVNNSYVANTKIDGIRAGGLAGIIQDTSFDTVYIYNTTGTDPDFGVVTSSNNAGTFNNVIYSKESGTAFGDGSTVSGVTGLNMSAMQDQSVMQGYGFTASNGWAYQPNAIPTLGTVTTSTAPAEKVYVSSLSDFVAGNTYYIKSAADLNKLAELVNNGKDTTDVTFIMEDDIDMSGVSNFAGIGNSSNSFNGKFYGNGHVIKKLTINSSANHVGLFGRTSGATIQDVGLENVNITSTKDVGSDGSTLGALIGLANNTTIINSYVDGGTINSPAMYTGGLVGNGCDVNIDSSWTNVNIDINSPTSSAGLYVGGLLGQIAGGSINESFSLSNITGEAQYGAGGLVGHFNATITNAYATGNVSSTSIRTDTAVGGLIGRAYGNNSTITNAFYSGSTLSGTNVGGLIGTISSGDAITVTNSVFNSAAASNAVSSGNVSGTASALTMDQLKNQSTMQGYGFTTANGWQYTAGTTPHFGNTTATTVGFDMTTSTTIGQLFGDSNSHTLTVQVEGGTAKNITFSSSDTVQTVIDKLAAEGIEAAVTGDHRFKVFDESRWTLSGEVATKLFGGSGNNVYTYTGNKITYDETVTVPGNDDGYKYTGDKIQYSTSSSGFPSSYTKLVDIFGNEVIGKQIIYKDYSPSNCMNHHGSDHPTTVTIDANTTIDSLNLHSNAFVHFSYDPTNGEFIFTKTKFSDGCEGQVSGSFLSYLKSKYGSDVTSTTLGTSGGITQSQEKEVISLPDSMNTTTTTWHDLTTSTTMKDLFGNTSSHTLTIKAEDGTAKSFNFSSTDTVQTVIDKLAAEGIDASVTAEHKFSVFDEKRWTLSGDVATKLFGGSGNDVYTTSSNKITYEETVPGTSTSGGFVESPENIQGSTGSGSTGTGDGFINDPDNVKAGGCFIASTINRSELGAVHVSDVDDFVSGETYLISTAQDLLKLAELTNGTKDINNNGVLDVASTSNVTFILTNDIDMSGYEWLGIGKVLDETVYSDWENGCFKGKFYGKGHIISGLSGALFNATKDALIQDVGIENISFTTGYGNAGIGNRRSALIDTAANTTITNVYATGAVEGGTGFGGLVYYLSGASSALTNSYTDIDMTISRSSYGYSYGGLVSIVSNISQISNSFAAGDIILDGTVESCVGGLIGKLNIGATSQSLSLSNLYSVSNISGSLTGGSVGGIIGNISDNVSTNKISMGTIYYAGDLSATVSDSTGATALVGAKGSIIGSIDDRYSAGNSPSNIFSLIIGVVYTGDVSAVGAATARDGVTRTGDVTLNGITKLSQSEITNQSKMESLGFTTGWKYTAGTTPYLGSMAVSSISPETTKTYVSSLSDSDDFVSGETYYIKTADDLVKLAELTHNGANTENVSFVLENDINMSGIDFEGIGTYDDAFRGNFYGNGHTISNLTMTSSDALDSFGFFNEIEGALIQDVALKNVTITGTSASAVGSLVGGATSSTIINSYVDGTNITALGAIGGLVGYAFDNTSITSSYVNDAVLIATFTGGASEMGGLVGSIDTSTISKSYVSNSNLLGEGSDIGGLVGIAYEVDISDAYVAFTNVASNASGVIGALAGSLNQSTLNRIYVSNSSAVNNADGTLGGAIAHDTGGSTYSNVVYCDNSLLAPADFTQAFGNGSTATGVITITDPDDICRESVMSAYGFTAANGWHYGATGYTIYGPTFGNSTGGSGTGSAGKVYVSTLDDFVAGETYYISTAADLQKLASLVKQGKDTTDVTFILDNNIDMTGESWDSIGTFNSNPYTPGTSTAFKGKFYGNGHTITGLSKSLFDWTVGAKVQDVGLEDIKRGTGSAAGLIRYAEDTIIKNVYVTSDGTISGGEFGGLVYSMNGGSITSSYTDIDVDITDSDFSAYGGLVAYLGGGISISKSYTTGDISINRTNNNVLRVGGLVGSISAYASDGNVTISDVYSTSNFSGTVSGNLSNVGGLIGFVTAGDSGFNDPVINRAYYGGTMTSLMTAPGNSGLASYIGAVIGGAMNTDGGAVNTPNTNFLKNITNVVYNKNAGASATASDPSAAGMTGLTLDEIQNQTTMQGYGFTSANGWVFNAGQTPNFGNMTGSAGSTTTKDATLDTTIAQLVDGYTSGTISISGGGSISLSGSDTLQDVIDKLNNNGIIASWNNGKIDLESDTTVTLTENNGFISKLFGSNSVTLNAISPAAGDYTMDKVGASGSSSSTVTHDATLNTTIGQLVGGDARFMIEHADGSGDGLEFSASDTIQDVIDKLNDNGIMASWNNGKISVEAGEEIKIYHDGHGLDLVSKLFGSSSITFSPVSSISGSYTMDKVTSGTGTTTNTYTMDASTTIGDLFGDSNNHTFTVNGNNITLGPDDTVQDLIDALAGYGVTATINDGKMTIGSNGDSVLTVSGDLANKVLGKTGSGSVSVDYKTEQRTLSLSTTMSELFWDNDSHDFVINKTNGQVKISLSGNDTIQDLITKLQAQGIVATIDSSGKMTFKSNFKWSVSGDLGNKVTEGVMNLTVTPLYTFESEELEVYTGHQTVSQILNAGGDLITGNRYHIATVDDLKALAEYVNNSGRDLLDIDFILDNDIDMTGVTDFVPIGTQSNYFTGNFYGNGHVISNLKITSSDNGVGLFGYVGDGTIRDLGLEDVDISGNDRVGALAGYVNNATIENVYSTGKVTGAGDQIGGLIGDVNSSNVKNVYSTAEVEGNTNVGGLIGYLGKYSVLENSYATGDVHSKAYQAGGLVGGIRYGGTIRNSYATGDVYGVENVGGLVGLFEGNDGNYTYTLDTVYSTGRVEGTTNVGALIGWRKSNLVTVTNAVYNSDLEMTAVGNGSISRLTGLTYVDMQDAARMQGLGFTTAKGWKYISDKMTPVLNSVSVDNSGRVMSGDKTYVRGLTEFEAGDTYYIGTAEDLVRLAELVNAGEDTTGSVFILDGDINMAGVHFTSIGCLEDNAFRGDFYGNGHEISNLTIDHVINGSTNGAIGLFGFLEGAKIQDVAIVDANIKSAGSKVIATGILAGYADRDSSITNVYTTGTVSGKDSTGGLLGYNDAQIMNVYSTANVSGGSETGGLIGENGSQGVVIKAYSTGLVQGSSQVGGFVGQNFGSIMSSYSTGRVVATGGNIGGFVGYHDGQIDNSYATGFVEGNSDVGGFAGYSDGNITGAVYNQSTKLNAVGSGSSSGITGLELSQMWEQDRMEGLGFTADKGWLYADNTTPFLNTNNTMVNGDKTYVRDADSFDSGEVFYIGTAQDLVHLAELVKNGAVTTGVIFVLDNDIVMTGVDFDPIGTSSDAFKGVFMGNGHTISGLNASLFGYVEEAIIRDVGLENVNSNYGAALVENIANGKTEITNVYAKGTVTGGSSTGGLVGYIDNSATGTIISDSYAEVNVTGSLSGGLVGVMNAGTIRNSYASGNVTNNGSYGGGLVGGLNNATIENSFASGNVSTRSGTVGGLVGRVNNSTITGSYASGVVTGGKGFIASTAGSNTFSGNVYNNAAADTSGAATGISLDEIKRQSVMEDLGFTSDKGWVYYEDQTPQLRGKDTSKQYTVDASLDSILANLGDNSISKDITVEINGTTHTQHFNDTDTVEDVMNWLNGISGVTAAFDETNSQLTVTTDDGEMNITGGLANTLFGGYTNRVYDKITQNTDSSHLMAAGGDAIITENTTVKQLLNSNNAASIGFIDEDGKVVMESFDPDQTLGEVIDYLNAHGFNASITNGVFTAVKEDGSKTDIIGAIGSALKGENGTTTTTPSGYVSDVLTSVTGEKATGTTQLSALGIDSGTISIQDKNGNIIQNVVINNTMTVNDAATLLANYGITMSITDGKVTVTTEGPLKLVDGSSNMVSQMQLDNWIENKSKLTNTSTVAEMGFAKGAALGVIVNGKTTTISFNANDTLDDIITKLNAMGIEASVDADGKFTATSDNGFVLTDELGTYLTQNSVDGYVEFANGYKSDKPLESPGNSTILTEDSLVGDILGTGEGGILRLTLDENTVVDLQYNADDTMQDIMVDLAAYGIQTQIKNGVLTAVNLDRTFTFSGDIGKAISGNTPLYENIETGYISKDLSYETVETANMNSTMKELGILGGQIHILNSEGGIVTTLDIDESFTVSQIKSMLSPYGFNLTMDANGKVSMTSSEGYSVSDGTSNLADVMGLDNWNQTTEKLALDTTISEMGFKDGADLNLFLDGAVMNVLSFDADQTLQDVIFALSAYGIDATVDSNGKFSAVSKEHTFIMSSTLGSFLTKGTSGYVNDDTGYQTVETLEEEKPYTVNSSEQLGYEKLMSADSTLASLGYENGGSVIVNLDGDTYYTLSFLGTDTVQDVIYALSPYGITAEVDANGKFNAVSVDHSFTLTGNVGNFLASGGKYQNEVTGYESDPITFETEEKVSLDTKLSSLGITHGDFNIMKDGKVTGASINITDDTTVGQLFNAIKVYGMEGKIMTDTNGETYIQISADSNTYLADGTANIVSGLGLVEIRQGDFEGNVIYWEDDTDSGLITEDMLLSTLDKDGYIAQGSLIFETGTGDEAVQHIINITADETVGSLIKKFRDAGIDASLSNGVIKISSGLDGITFTGGTSGLVNTIGLDIENVDVYASSSSALTYEGDVHYSAANFANGDTLLDIVNATEGDMSIFVDGVKCTIHVDPTKTFADLFAQISSEVAARTGLNIKAGFLDKEGNIVVNPTDDKNTGIIAFEVDEGHELVVGASNDTTNFATIANLNKTGINQITGSRSLYRVNVNSLITESGLYRDGDITEGTFKIGDAEFTIDSTTTLASLIEDINHSQTAYATAYWDTLSGTMVIQSTLTGASLINIEAGTSNFTDIMGFTTVTDTGASALVTSSQTLGKNAVIRINGTTVTATSNVITSDVSRIKGLTINLKDVSEGETVTITVEQDDEAIFNAVSDTIDAYNAMMEALNKELSDKNTLGNEALLKLMRNNLKRLMTSSLSGAYIFKNLAAIGISTGEAQDSITLDVTNLIIDKDKFMNALDTDSDAVKSLLVGSEKNPGIFLQANNIVESSIKSTGYFSNMIDSLTRNIDRIQDKINKTNDEITKYRDRLERQFHNMELTISGLQNAYSAFLN